MRFRDDPGRPPGWREARFEIDAAAAASPEIRRREPLPAAGLPPVGPEFGNPAASGPVIPDLAAPGSDRPRACTGRPLRFGLLGSLALHLLPFALLLGWSSKPAEMQLPIPVRLIVEPPPPPPPAPPPLQTSVKPPPPGRLASEDVGAPAEQPEDAAAPSSVTAPAQRRAAALVPPPKPPPPPEPQDLASPQGLAAPALAPPAKPAIATTSVRQPPPRPRPPQRAARVPGPAATRDDYLAYLARLTRPYLQMLPPNLINGRHGTTSLAIRVLGDGTIARIAVSQSSGDSDIDSRVVQMIAAIGRFPPLPQWIQEPSWDINFRLSFPLPAADTQRP